MESQGVFEKIICPRNMGFDGSWHIQKTGVIWGGRSKGALEEYGSRCGGQMASGSGHMHGPDQDTEFISESLEIRKAFSLAGRWVFVLALAEVSRTVGGGCMSVATKEERFSKSFTQVLRAGAIGGE